MKPPSGSKKTNPNKPNLSRCLLSGYSTRFKALKIDRYGKFQLKKPAYQEIIADEKTCAYGQTERSS